MKPILELKQIFDFRIFAKRQFSTKRKVAFVGKRPAFSLQEVFSASRFLNIPFLEKNDFQPEGKLCRTAGFQPSPIFI